MAAGKFATLDEAVDAVDERLTAAADAAVKKPAAAGGGAVKVPPKEKGAGGTPAGR